MSTFEDYLAPEDREAYRVARGQTPKPQRMEHLIEDVPDWKDQFETMLYTRFTKEPPSTGSLLASEIFNHDAGAAGNRRYAPDLDGQYIRADGTFDKKLWDSDQFVLKVEEAYYQNRGKLPLEFFLDYADDLALLGGDFAETAQVMFHRGLIESQRLATRESEAALFNRDADFIAEWQKVGKSEAILAWANANSLVNSYGEDWERGQAALEELTGGPSGINYRELHDMAKEHELAVPIKPGHTYEEAQWIRDAAGQYVERKAGDVAPEGDVRVTFGRRTYDQLSERRGDVAAFEQLMMDTIAAPMGWVVDGVGWSLERGGGLPGMKQVVNGLSDLFASEEDFARGKDEAIAAMEAQIGMDTKQFALQQSFLPVDQLWTQMVGNNDSTYREYMIMADGNADLARDMFIDSVIFREDNLKEIAKQKAIFDSKLEYQIKELENTSFTMSDKLMGILSAWGEAMEYVATGAMLQLENIVTEGAMQFDDQFWTDIRNHDTPASVLGLDGTLIGLIFDLGATMAVDPTTYVFGPRLAPGGAVGALHADDAVRIAGNKASQAVRREVVQAARGASHNATAYAAAIDNMMATGHAEKYIARTRGFTSALDVPRAYTGTPVASTVDDISYHLLDNLIDDVDAGALQEAMEGVKASKALDYVEVTANPSTGGVAITANEHVALGLRGLGYDSVPVTIKLDPDFGGTVYKRVAGQTDEQAIRMNQIADGTIEKQLIDEGKVVKADRKAVEKMTTRGKEALEYTPDPELEGIFGPRETRELGHVMSKNGDKLRLVRHEQGGVVDYLVYDVSQGGVGAPMGGVSIVDGEITMGLAKRARGAMHQIWDEAAKAGDDLLELHGNSPSTSQDAIDFAKRYASEKLKGANETVFIPDETLQTAEWAKGIQFDELDVRVIDGDTHILPRRAMGDDIYGEADLAGMEADEVSHMLAGGQSISGQRTVIGIASARVIGDLLRGGEAGFFNRIGEFLTPINSNLHFSLNGPTAAANINQFGRRLWASAKDTMGFDVYQTQLLDFWGRRGRLQIEADRLSSRYVGLERRIGAMEDFLGGTLDQQALGLKGQADEGVKLGNARVLDEVEALIKERDALRAEQKRIQGELRDTTKLNDILDDMMNEFNRKHIATNPKWKEAGIELTEDGLVPWEEITGRSYESIREIRKTLEHAQRRGMSAEQVAKGEAGYIPKEIADAIDEAIDNGLPVNSVVSDALDFMNNRASWNAPASPLELMGAAQGGPGIVKQIQHRQTVERAIEGAYTAQMLWALDKVLTPKTAAVVSIDELVRIAHLGGTKAVSQMLEDKTMQVTRRIAGERVLPKRWRDRLVRLQEYPIHFRQLERAFLETTGVGYDVIKYGKGSKAAPYYDAAQRTSGQMLNDIGFQKYLEGPLEFKRWFESDTNAARLRSMEYLDPTDGNTVKTGVTADMLLSYYDAVFEGYALRNIPAGRLNEARKLWKDAAVEQAARGSTAGGPITLPNWVLRGYGEVTGNVQIAPLGMRNLNKISDLLFQQPVNYRRGFLAEWVRKSEGARLKKLFANQGKKIYSNAEYRALIKRQHPHWGEDLIEARIPSLRQEMFERQGVISQAHVDELIEFRVVAEMENALYSFQMNSKGGKAARAVAPFGKPYADMMGFWGRELLSKPALRGWINESNYFNMGGIASKMVDKLPFNPKTAAFVSRIAGTDFDLDRIQDDPVVGSLASAIGLEGADLSGALFMPNEGNAPFGVLLPGLGVIPVGMLHMAFSVFSPDPVENPLEYQQWIDNWSQFLPGVGRSQGQDLVHGIANLIAGGGVVSRTAQTVDAFGAVLGTTIPGEGTLGTGWSGRIEANRTIKTIFQDADIFEEFADIPPNLTEEALMAWIDEKLAGAVSEAHAAQGRNDLKEIATEFQVPIRADYGGANDQLTDVWIKSVGWMGMELPSYMDTSTESGQKAAADWARTRFFALPDWERDALVAENHALAVNLVSMWEWTDKARQQKNLLSDTGTPYRSGGSTADLARHQTYQQLGYIQPVTPAQMATRIIGTVLQARVQTARQLYVEAATQVNEQRWEQLVPEEWKVWLDAAAQELSSQNKLPYRTGKELWMHYTELKKEADVQTKRPDGEPSVLAALEEFRPWSAQMPSSPFELREEFEEGYPIPRMTDKMEKMAAALGLDLTPLSPTGRSIIEMDEVYQLVADSISREYLDNPVFVHVADDYKAWSGQRGAGAQATAEIFGRVLDNSVFDEETVYQYKKTLLFIEEVQDRKAMNDPSWLDLRDYAATRFQTMMTDDALQGLNAKQLWDQAWGNSLGSLDWKPLEPPPLVREGGGFTKDASPVYVARVLDGDTIDITYGDSVLPGNQYYRVRLLGYNAAELGSGGETERDELRAAVRRAIDSGTQISIVRDPRFGDTDMYGRMFAWLYIGDEPWYDPETMIPRNN